ncbi:hypothetical protein PV327_010830 [Microctonus hyperodae]|uniref:Uncharacterized protein n=1 Tax=Microctonus hyperodae TaxID=165561 RepID=A0AA39F0D8_MICHY|nr:hypothetical protein PV327_010830 [Microctonus hyperodae]
MILHDEAYYENRRPIQDLGPFKNCMRFIWDGERRAFLDRTARDWGSVGLFYLCFFGILFSIFSLQLFITLKIVAKPDRPYIARDIKPDSVISRSSFQEPHLPTPGLGLTPNIQISLASPFILLGQDHDKANTNKYITLIDDLLNGYNQNLSNYDVECDQESLKHNSLVKPCFFDIKSLKECSQLPYGYSKPYKPCIYLKFNKKFDWVPIYYNRTSKLPDNMPTDLKSIIKITEKPHVWLSCDGVTDYDKDHIGIIEYLPKPGFPVHYFPFTGHDKYLSPIVALKFNNITSNRLITVECYTWAENIHQDESHTLDFQIVIN